MHFSTSTLLALVPFLSIAFAAPATAGLIKRTGDLDKPFTSLALRAASPIHFASVNAYDSSLHLYGTTASYCPTTAQPCPPGNVTSFSIQDGTAFMNVEVPGGQQLYVAPDGRLSYTIAHSGAIPEGSTTSGFTHTAGEDGSVDTWSFSGGGATGLLACPGGDGTYSVYADVPGFKGGSACLGFDGEASPYEDGVAAWQYT